VPGADDSTLSDSAARQEAIEAAENRSLIDDVEVLIEDGRTYLEAELNYQTTRARFVGDRAKRVVLWAAIGLLFAWMALIALTVGLIVALTPPLSAWGATAVVTLSVAASRWREVVRSFDDGEEDAA
jgi:hypothetical protein